MEVDRSVLDNSESIPDDIDGVLDGIIEGYKIVAKEKGVNDCISEFESDRKSQLEKIEAANKGVDLDLKIQYGHCVLGILIGWCVFVIIICCIHMDKNYDKLSDSVLITLFSTTTIHIIGLPWVVLNYLFSKK